MLARALLSFATHQSGANSSPPPSPMAVPTSPGAATGFQDQFSSYSRRAVSPTPHSLDCSSDGSASASDHVKMLRIGRAGTTMYEVESSRRRTRLRAAAVNSG